MISYLAQLYFSLPWFARWGVAEMRMVSLISFLLSKLEIVKVMDICLIMVVFLPFIISFESSFEYPWVNNGRSKMVFIKHVDALIFSLIGFDLLLKVVVNLFPFAFLQFRVRLYICLFYDLNILIFAYSIYMLLINLNQSIDLK